MRPALKSRDSSEEKIVLINKKHLEDDIVRESKVGESKVRESDIKVIESSECQCENKEIVTTGHVCKYAAGRRR